MLAIFSEKGFFSLASVEDSPNCFVHDFQDWIGSLYCNYYMVILMHCYIDFVVGVTSMVQMEDD